MRVLIVKTSSLGDVIHTLPAVTDAQRAMPEIHFDWVVEDAFAEIPAWHPAVREVIPVSVRRWRKHPWQAWRSGAWRMFSERLRQHDYDHVIDAQGLLKSAFLAWQAKGLRSGLDSNSAREPWAAKFYQRRYAVAKGQHAITRVRQLFAAVLGYACPQSTPDYGIHASRLSATSTLVFLHGTTWPTKHWPESYWVALALRAAEAGYRVRLPWGNQTERRRAERIARQHEHIGVIPPASLGGLSAEISTATAVVGVDTGLVHLAAALGVPSLTVYGATDPALTGTLGAHQQHLQADFACAPCLRKRCDYRGESAVQPACYMRLDPETVWAALMQLIE